MAGTLCTSWMAGLQAVAAPLQLVEGEDSLPPFNSWGGGMSFIPLPPHEPGPCCCCLVHSCSAISSANNELVLAVAVSCSKKHHSLLLAHFSTFKHCHHKALSAITQQLLRHGCAPKQPSPTPCALSDLHIVTAKEGHAVMPKLV
jgi:hypothetical protein